MSNLITHKGKIGEGEISADINDLVDIWIKDWTDPQGNLATHTMHLGEARKWAFQLIKAIDDFNAKKSILKQKNGK